MFVAKAACPWHGMTDRQKNIFEAASMILECHLKSSVSISESFKKTNWG
jgi:hypothetical protein